MPAYNTWALLVWLHGVWRYLNSECSKPTFFMPDIQLELIEELSLLYRKEEEERESVQQQKATHIFNVLEDLHKSYQQEKEQIYQQYIRPFISKYFFLNHLSSLSIIGKENQETYHSCYLKKIWDSQTESGSIILTDFLKTIEIKGDWIETVICNQYNITTEYFTGKQRKRDLCAKKMDLLIKDDVHKWLIGIENKIRSEVHSDKRSGRSQLEFYKDYCERTFPDYKRIFILLSHCDNKSYAQKSNWKYTDYYSVMKLFLKYHQCSDTIKDYLKTLYSLLFNKEEFDTRLYNEATSLYDYNLFINRIISKIY